MAWGEVGPHLASSVGGVGWGRGHLGPGRQPRWGAETSLHSCSGDWGLETLRQPSSKATTGSFSLSGGFCHHPHPAEKSRKASWGSDDF